MFVFVKFGDVNFSFFICVGPHARDIVLGHVHMWRYWHRTVVFPLQKQLIIIVYPCNMDKYCLRNHLGEESSI